MAREADLAPGRRPLILLTVVAGVGAALLVPGLFAALAVPGSDSTHAVGPSGAAFGDGPVALAVVVVAAVVGAVLAARRWLGTAARRTGASSVGALLAAVAGRPGGPAGGIAAARRSTGGAAIAAGVGAAALGLGEAAWQAAADPDLARAGGIGAAGGAAAIVLAAAVVPSILRAVERRELDAAGARAGRQGWIPAARSPRLAVAATAVLLGLVVVPFAVQGEGTPVACGLDGAWECRAIRVPVDHFQASRAQDTLEVTYAIHPAAAPASRRRVLVIATGGPGASGIADGTWMVDALDPRITRAFDVVTFDARGVGLSDGRDCPRAAREYSMSLTDARTARNLVERCIREADVEGVDLHRYATVQTAEDIDAIRTRLGVERITLYGVSYGTVVAQAYAAAHPDHLDGLVLDAPIDRQLPAARVWSIAAHGFLQAVAATLGSCSSDPDCSADLADPERAYERLSDELASGPLNATVTRFDGQPVPLTLSRPQFDTMTFAAMYGTTTRMAWLRALAAYDHGDRRPLVHLYDAWIGGDSSSSFAYYATWCADTRASPTARTDDFDAYIHELVVDGVPGGGPRDVASSIAPCVFWPAQPATAAPPPDAAGVRTLILTTTSDPITPSSEAKAILGRLPDARLVETRAGGHGSLGQSCPNERMADFVVDGRLPVAPTSVCLGQLADPFIRLMPSRAVTATDAALGTVREILAAPESLGWDGTGDLQLGCADGGTVTLVVTPESDDPPSRTTATLDGCAWASAATFDGTGWIDLRTGDAELQLQSIRGDLHLTWLDGRWRVSGTWDDTGVDESG